MKFKIDENLPVEIVETLQAAKYDAVSVFDQQMQGSRDAQIADICKQEEQAIITLDLDFSDIRLYPPQKFPGIIVLRVYR